MTEDAHLALGKRLVAQERRLHLLCAHLSSRAVRARVELDDLVQEVFVRALAKPDAVPPFEPGEAALWRFLSVLARHTVIDVARALRTKRRGGTEEPLLRSDWSRAPAAAGPGPHTAAATGEGSRALARSFLALPPEHRRVLGLRQFAGLSAEEAGARMGRSAAAVHSLYRRALQAWQAALEENPGLRDESPRGRRP
ncbi:MAG TPA: RNA polymerase sigma factor [Planctomycetota bacterium]|nr:RNA polymerase sigma factor [Planctomycetota bacterium]